MVRSSSKLNLFENFQAKNDSKSFKIEYNKKIVEGETFVRGETLVFEVKHCF